MAAWAASVPKTERQRWPIGLVKAADSIPRFVEIQSR